MNKYLVEGSNLSAIGSAIRAKNGSSTAYKPSEMAAAIAAIPTGTAPTGTINITQNGTTDVTQYASAAVNVPNSYVAADEGKVVSNGELVAQTARSSEITANGTYDTTENNSVTVNVGGGGSILPFTALSKYVLVSTNSGDKMTRRDRYFTRTSGEPILMLSAAYLQNKAIAYSGYAAIAFSSSGVPGTFSSYGNLTDWTEKVTPNGTSYWIGYMNGMYPPSESSGFVQFDYGSPAGTLKYVISMDKLVINASTRTPIGDESLKMALYGLIDAIYTEYYSN